LISSFGVFCVFFTNPFVMMIRRILRFYVFDPVLYIILSKRQKAFFLFQGDFARKNLPNAQTGADLTV